MSSKYVDQMSNIMVLGGLLREPSILDRPEKYAISDEDFVGKTQQMSFLAINNLFVSGLKKIEIVDIINYLQKNYPAEYLKFEKDEGVELLKKAISVSTQDKFDYYYNRMKKFSLLRAYDRFGIDVNDIYNINALDLNLKEKQERWLEECEPQDIVDIVDRKIEKVKKTALLSGIETGVQASEGIFDLLDRLDKFPEVGVPLPFGIYNTITAGARLGKVYLSSAASGKGKSRNMVADTCYLACSEIWNNTTNKWDFLTTQEPSLLITTELQLEEVQTMMLAFISGVNESKILNKESKTSEERERIYKAAKILQEAPIYVSEMPDFSLSDIENTIKANIEDYDVKYICLDYIHTSLKILSEVGRATNGIKIREDQVLFMLSIRLKDLANQYGVFIQTATQTNALGESGEDANASMLRGARAIADVI